MKNQKGFTLIEIMVVVIIIGVLSAIVAPTVVTKLEDARIEAAKADIRIIATALKFYRVDNFSYPTTEMGLEALVQKPSVVDAPNWKAGGYLDDSEVPTDPWGQEYLYLSPGPDGSEYYVYSLGPDRRPGGDGNDADLTSSDL